MEPVLKRRKLVSQQDESVVLARARALSWSDFKYHEELYGHYSCVNVTVLNQQGTLLATGGDDRRVLLWNALGEMRNAEPVAEFAGGTSNLFAAEFTRDSRTLLAGDTRLMVYDVETGRKLSAPQYPDQECFFGVSVHSISVEEHPSLFRSGGEDGFLTAFDLRVSGLRTSRTFLGSDVHGIERTPMASILALCTTRRAGLFDVRAMPTSTPIQGGATPAPAVRTFNTSVAGVLRPYDTLATRRRLARERLDVSSMSLDPSGQLICLTLSRYLPTLFDLSDERPLAVFDSPAAPGETGSGFRDISTLKQGSFGGAADDLYYAHGSDDHAVYGWSVPSIPTLRERLDAFPFSDTFSTLEATAGSRSLLRHAAFVSRGGQGSDAAEACIPTIVDTPAFRITDHRSIPNRALFHPRLPMLFTSGVEKTVRVHSTRPFDDSVPRRRVPLGKRVVLDPPHEPSDEPEDQGLKESIPGLVESIAEREVRRTTEDTSVLEFFDWMLYDEKVQNEVFWFTSDREVESGDEADFSDEDDEDEDEESDNDIELFDPDDDFIPPESQ